MIFPSRLFGGQEETQPPLLLHWQQLEERTASTMPASVAIAVQEPPSAPAPIKPPLFRGKQLGRVLPTPVLKETQEREYEALGHELQAVATIPTLVPPTPVIHELQDIYDFELDRQDTIPMMVLKGISQQQNQPTPVMQSEISGAASNAAAVGFGNVANYVFKYGNNFLMQRGLGIENFGLYSLSMSFITLVSSLLNLGLDDAMVRYVAIYRSKKQAHLLRNLTIFCSLLAGITGVLGALLVLAFASPIAAFEHKPDIMPVLEVMAPLIPLACLQAIWVGGLQGFKQFKRRVVLQRMVIPALLFLLTLLVIIYTHNLIAVTLVVLVGSVMSLLINLAFLFPLVTQHAAGAAEKRGEYRLREWLGFAVPNFLTSIVTTVLDAIDTLLLGFFSISNAAIGQYVAALKITGFIGMPLYSLNVMFAPTIAELYSQGEREKLGAMFKVVTKWTITFSLPIFCIACIFAVPLLNLSGGRFAGGWPLVIALAVGSLCNIGTGSVGYMLLMTGHQRLSLLNSIGAVLINGVLGFILTPRFGAMGTAISTGLAVCIINLLSLLEVRIFVNVQPYRWDTLKPVAAALLSSVVTLGGLYVLNHMPLPAEVPYIHMHVQPYVQLLLIPAWFVSYVVVLMLLKIGPEDQIVLDKLRKKLKRGKGKKK